MRNWLLAARERKALSQNDVAKTVFITQAAYSYIESGKRSPSPRVAKRIAAVLDIDWTRFYEDPGKV